MMLDFNLKKDWPKLAWVCVVSSENDSAVVMHGSMVEINEHWAVEAVWDGEFVAGDFDKTDLVFGSGIRQRDSELIFVSSATGVDRLWHVTLNNNTYVSNTLPGLLSVADLSLRDDYHNYAEDIMSVENKGIYRYTKQIPSSGPDICVVYFKNILWSSGELAEIEKLDNIPVFTDFNSYEDYLKNTAEGLGINARSSLRMYQVDMLVGISSGYDSVATAVVSRYAGCNKAASIVNSSSLWRGSDSGQHIAEKLNLDCQLVTHSKKKYKFEVSTWAAAGHAGGRSLTLFDYPKPLCLFFNGSYGDTVWNRSSQGLKEPKGDMDALMCEYRLIEGFFVTVVPWWGIRKVKDIQKISLLKEMEPWTLGTDYDRPIARRLAEEAGIERRTFAIRKKDTASNEPLWWPSTPLARKGFRTYLKALGFNPLSDTAATFLSKLSYIISLIYRNTARRLGIKKWWRPWRKIPGRHLLFVWANHDLRDRHYSENT